MKPKTKKEVYLAILKQRDNPRFRLGFSTIQMADEIGSWIGDAGFCLRLMQSKGIVCIYQLGNWIFMDEEYE